MDRGKDKIKKELIDMFITYKRLIWYMMAAGIESFMLGLIFGIIIGINIW